MARDEQEIVANPFYAIEFDAALFGEHPPFLSRGEWVAENLALISELGAERWLNLRLDVLGGSPS